MINVAKFVSVLAVFICAVAGTVWSAVAAERSAATRAFEKLEIADGLLAAMLAREGALRGYFLTKDASFFEPYDEASLELAEAADLALTGADGEAERASVAAQELSLIHI